MAYRQTSAGHEDAPLEQRTHTERPPQIISLCNYLDVCVHNEFCDDDALKRDEFGLLDGLLSQSPQWSYPLIRQAFLDEHVLSSLAILDSNHKVQGSVWLYAQLLSTVPENVLEFGGLYPPLRVEHLSALERKVFLFELTSKDYGVVSDTSSPSLLVMTETSSPAYFADRFHFLESSVIVDLSPTPNLWVCGDVYLMMAYKPDVIIERDRTVVFDMAAKTILCVNQNNVGMYRETLQELSALGAITAIPMPEPLLTCVDDLVNRCRYHPHSLHEHYGPTPGPSVLTLIRGHLVNARIEGISDELPPDTCRPRRRAP